jgi:hypothetical protein
MISINLTFKAMIFGKTKFFIAIAVCILFSGSLYSQADTIPVRDDQVKKTPGAVTHNLDLGFGLGLDYGGLLGVQLGIAPIKHLTLFAAGGYYILQFGWQVGLKGLFIAKTTKHGFRPFLKAMYGTNSVISVEGADYYDKVYKGFTVGLGFELRFGRMKKNGFDLDLNVPLRTPDFWSDWNEVENDPNMDVINAPIPVAFSVGYHHEF